MPRFTTFDGLQLAYETQGDGFPILLIHGFAADSFIQWERAGLSDKLVGAGRRVIMLDLRGHGMSAKPHDAEAYADDAIDKDAIALLDHLSIERCDVMGYSMGSWTTARLVSSHPGRFRAAVLGGIGRMVPSSAAPSGGNPLAEAMLAPDKSTITSPIGRSFRDYADMTGADKTALAAFQQARHRGAPDLGTISIPVLVITGDNDPLAPNPQELAAAIPGAKSVVVGGTHLNVVNNPAYHDAVLQFLAAQD